MKSIFSAAVVVTAIVACLTSNVQANSVSHLSSNVTVSDTGKMSKMSKMKTKKMSKMSKSKMKKDTMKKM